MKYDYLQGVGSDGWLVQSVAALNGEFIHYIHVYSGAWGGSGETIWESDAKDAAELTEAAWQAHNRATRVRGRQIRSMSVGDVLVVDDGADTSVWFCDSVGWVRLLADDAVTGAVLNCLVSVGERRAYGTVETARLFQMIVAGREAARGRTTEG